MALVTLKDTYFGNTIEQYLIALAVFAGSLILARILMWIVRSFVRRFAEKTETKFDDIVVDCIEYPAMLLIGVIGFHIGYNSLNLPVGAQTFFAQMVSVVVIILVGWVLAKFLDSLVVNYLIPIAEKSKSDLDDHLIPLIRKIIRIVIVIIAGVMIISDFGYNVSSILAGLGLGGLAFALAAKDMLSNLFGGVSIIMDRPFKIGERIQVSGIDGIVKEIGLRTTKIRALDGRMVTLPNADVANEAITNVAKEPSRKVSMTLGLTYDMTPVKLDKAMSLVQKILEKEALVDQNKKYIWFDEYADFSLNIKVVYFIATKDWNKIIETKTNVNLAIKKKFKDFGIEMAFPTTTVELKK